MIYFITGNPDIAPIKIGYTRGQESLRNRVAQIQTGHPWKLFVIHTLNGKLSMERMLHNELNAHRLEGEWFDKNPVTTKFIENIKVYGIKAALEIGAENLDPAVELFKHTFSGYIMLRAGAKATSISRFISLLRSDCLLSKSNALKLIQGEADPKGILESCREMFWASKTSNGLNAQYVCSSALLVYLASVGINRINIGFEAHEVRTIGRRPKAAAPQPNAKFVQASLFQGQRYSL